MTTSGVPFCERVSDDKTIHTLMSWPFTGKSLAFGLYYSLPSKGERVGVFPRLTATATTGLLTVSLPRTLIRLLKATSNPSIHCQSPFPCALSRHLKLISVSLNSLFAPFIRPYLCIHHLYHLPFIHSLRVPNPLQSSCIYSLRHLTHHTSSNL